MKIPQGELQKRCDIQYNAMQYVKKHNRHMSNTVQKLSSYNFVFLKNYFLQWRMLLQQTVAKVI